MQLEFLSSLVRRQRRVLVNLLQEVCTEINLTLPFPDSVPLVLEDGSNSETKVE